QWVEMGTIVRGWALVQQRQIEEGLAQMQQGLAALPAIANVGWIGHLPLLAEAYVAVGQSEEGLTVVAEALTAVDKAGERVYEAELYRLRGELTLQKVAVATPQPPPPDTQAEAEAEACFLKALEIAHRQQAKALELRAVMSLSRLWQQQGKKEEAR